MATFKCLQSGNTVTFTLQHDIDSMRGHQGYVRVDENAPNVEQYVAQNTIILSPPELQKRIGRPRKRM
jgi:hypothetical protein